MHTDRTRNTLSLNLYPSVAQYSSYCARLNFAAASGPPLRQLDRMRYGCIRVLLDGGRVVLDFICVHLCPSVAKYSPYCAKPNFAAAFTISAAAGAALVPPYTPFSTNTETAILRVPVP